MSKSGNGYVVSRSIPLQDFIAIRNKLIPKMIIYSIFFLGFTIGSLTTIITSGFSVDKLLVIMVSSISSVIFFLEGLNMRRKLS